jgi:diaminopimelate epimerase
MTAMVGQLSVWKGHGTENDFILIDDRDARLELSAELVRALCDRRSGVGADGVLRLARSANEADASSMASLAEYFMDYRNADGSIAEMCGNGIRLFALYLQVAGLAGDQVSIATRGGPRSVHITAPSAITVEMGHAELLETTQCVRGPRSNWSATGVGVRMPNPHVVVELDDLAALTALNLWAAPIVEPGLAGGQNVEFVVRTASRRLSMRVHERGSGETRSCGTGICAAVVALAAADPGFDAARDGEPWQVDVPGGTCSVRWRADGEVLLTGPAELVGSVDLDANWLAAAERRH